jgi:uncharacterized DUF497 family protein
MAEKVEFTKHALERMAERGADRKFVEAAIKANVNAVDYPSQQNPAVSLLTAKDSGGKHWTAIHLEGKVVTVRRAHKSEVNRYEEKYQKRS